MTKEIWMDGRGPWAAAVVMAAVLGSAGCTTTPARAPAQKAPIKVGGSAASAGAPAQSAASTPSTLAPPAAAGVASAVGDSAARKDAVSDAAGAAAGGATGGVAPAAGDAGAQAQAFADWLDQFRREALAAGIQESTVQRALGDVKLLPRVVARDRSQAEFTRPVWDYLATAASELRVQRGQQRLREWRDVLAAAAAREGVPAEIVVAIWGMESNYGANFGDIPTLDALATLAFDGRRGAWARGQLLAALRIIENGDIEPARMIGSWAGAMGQTQFLPSVYLAHAVDADGDGRRDIWSSMPDVIASTARFLRHEGWVAGEPWGQEVTLPVGFDVGRADGELRQTSAAWAAEGIRGVAGAPLAELADAAVLLPAGARGPAFLIGANFRTLLRYNNANSYALGVGLLAQRLGGGPGVRAAWPTDIRPLRRDELRTMQERLNTLGFESGNPDGVLGRATRSALRAWQRSVGLPADGYPTHEALQQLTAQR